jgi:glycosyltransferase involved in cell wall biosynthesis
VCLSRCAVLVPAWQPDSGLVMLVDALLNAGFGSVVVVDDGSGTCYFDIFEVLRPCSGVVVLTHAVNLGKGRALKTGFNHVLSAMPDVDAVVTADADGQHRVHDIAAVAMCLLSAEGEVVLGTREFGKEVPWRNWFGNRVTRFLFGLVAGVRVRDTQTGLRGFSREVLPELLVLGGERYEYEMSVLAYICKRTVPVELPIETLYLEGNRSSHFHPLWDSIRIYRVLMRLCMSTFKEATRPSMN